MTTRKAFVVKVEFDVQAVTCPGVWLCSNGQVSLQIYMLDSCVQTASIKPFFPMLFHEQFIFSKTLPSKYILDDLKNQLSKEWLYIELIQWETCDSGNVLAYFQIPVNELLYPSMYGGFITTGEIDLLMQSTPIFPGTIAPKLEVSTKTTIDETVCSCVAPPKCNPVVPKILCSTSKSKNFRNKAVCHSSFSCRPRKVKKIPRCVARCSKSNCWDRRPPFRYKRIEDGFLQRRCAWHYINGPAAEGASVCGQDDFIACREPCSICYSKDAASGYTPGHMEQICTVCQKYSGLFKNKQSKACYTANTISNNMDFTRTHKFRNQSVCPVHSVVRCNVSREPEQISVAQKLHERISKTLHSIPKYWDEVKQVCRTGKDYIAENVCTNDSMEEKMPNMKKFYRDFFTDQQKLKEESYKKNWRQ